LVQTIRTIGTENCIISTDFGQDFHPMPAEGMRMGIATLLQAGLVYWLHTSVTSDCTQTCVTLAPTVGGCRGGS
jgi:hypothetical protein